MGWRSSLVALLLCVSLLICGSIAVVASGEPASDIALKDVVVSLQESSGSASASHTVDSASGGLTLVLDHTRTLMVRTAMAPRRSPFLLVAVAAASAVELCRGVPLLLAAAAAAGGMRHSRCSLSASFPATAAAAVAATGRVPRLAQGRRRLPAAAGFPAPHARRQRRRRLLCRGARQGRLAVRHRQVGGGPQAGGGGGGGGREREAWPVSAVSKTAQAVNLP